MAKRVAARELNHDNWDQEEEEEEAGTFQKVKLNRYGKTQHVISRPRLSYY